MEAASMRWPEGIRQANLLLTTRTMSKLEKMWGGGGMMASGSEAKCLPYKYKDPRSILKVHI